jgi:hypothetical protein
VSAYRRHAGTEREAPLARKNTDKKRRTREHIIADLAVNHVERFVLRCGFTMQRIVHDYGLDGSVITHNSREEVENGLIWFQLKATDHVQEVGAGTAIAVRVHRRDLVYWLGEQYPVILVLYDASRDRAYWAHVQEEFGGSKIFGLARSGESITCHVLVEHLIDEKAINEFRRLKIKALRPR